jgi:hypothetical protein
MWRLVDAADRAFRALCDTVVEGTLVRTLQRRRG